jgi:hypothetical protein
MICRLHPFDPLLTHECSLNGLLIETSNGCIWVVGLPRITANCAFNFTSTLSVASVICDLN